MPIDQPSYVLQMRLWPINRHAHFLALGLVQILLQMLGSSILNKVKILFHSFPLGFVIPVDMSDDNLGVIMKED